ncbi:MAG: sn-glycerol-3-phosphate ABC transporter ATP-binding protein UgpC [Elusimicrobia bacterium]|nr:sn-glycerol-3-phosphate ABC transporter ATP-binding protein UgpC [Elusimicrobiota bacterium]
MASVTLRRISKRYQEATVLREISLEIADREFMILVGPSGCGKSTLLRMVAGLEDITEGEILIDGRIVNHLAPRDREIAMVFQDYALYPHMTVEENMSFGLRLRAVAKAEIDRRVQEAAGILQIQSLLKRTPRALSGGQRQRVAIGRAIVRKPKAFLFDEPLSNLDAKLREEMRVEIAKLHQRLGATIIYVTHDQVEAMTLGSRMAVMNGGIIQQVGTPAEAFARPANHFVAGFIGSPTMNFLSGTLEGGTFKSPDLGFKLPGARAAGPVILGVRPEGICVDRADGSASSEPVPAVIEVVELLGYKRNLYLKAGEKRLLATVDASFDGKPGDTVSMSFQLAGIHLFDKESKSRIA